MLSLICKCKFYRPEYNAKEGPHGTEFEVQTWNIPMDWAQRAMGKMLSFV